MPKIKNILHIRMYNVHCPLYYAVPRQTADLLTIYYSVKSCNAKICSLTRHMHNV